MDENVIKKDEEFGEFLYREKYRTFEGKINWQGKECKVRIKVLNDINNFELGMNTLREMYNDMENFNNIVK